MSNVAKAQSKSDLLQGGLDTLILKSLSLEPLHEGHQPAHPVDLVTHRSAPIATARQDRATEIGVGDTLSWAGTRYSVVGIVGDVR